MICNLPTFSIVTPSLNYERYIEDCILSVVGQEYPECEHLVVDGGSRDGTVSLLRRYPHLRWVSEPDRGQSDALNKGFRMATGDLVGWLNADEYYLPGALKAVGAFAAANPQADVIYADSVDVNEQGLVLRGRTGHAFRYPVLLYKGCVIPSDACFFRRRVFEEGFWVAVDYQTMMDFEFFVRLAHAGKRFMYLRRFVGMFRQHSHNMAQFPLEKRRNERLRIQAAWSAIKLPDRGYDTLANVFWAERILLKTLNGNYARERNALRFAGSETRWFRSAEGLRTCAALLA